MITTVCTLAASVGAAIFASYKIAAPKKERIVWTNVDNVSLAIEYQELGEHLLTELTRIQTSSKSDPYSVNLVVMSISKSFKRAWPVTGYYYKEVETFLELLAASSALQRESPSDEYIGLLKTIARQWIPKCSEAIIRKETGDVTDFSYNFHQDLKYITNQLAACNQRKLSSHSILKAGN